MTSSTSRLACEADSALLPQPWWRHGHVWLLIAGPAAVIVAGIATAVIAIRAPDPLVAQDYYRRGIEINKTLQDGADAKAMLPAVQGRNHAATPAGAIPAGAIPAGAMPAAAAAHDAAGGGGVSRDDAAPTGGASRSSPR